MHGGWISLVKHRCFRCVDEGRVAIATIIRPIHDHTHTHTQTAEAKTIDCLMDNCDSKLNTIFMYEWPVAFSSSVRAPAALNHL